jgi:NADH-quinone oxidoreductase subunit M
MSSYLLAALMALPAAGAFLAMFVPREEEGILRGIGFATSLVTFLVSLLLWTGFDSSQAGYQFVLDHEWIAGMGIHFKVGVDGISLWLVLLTTFLTPIVLLSAWTSIQKKVREFIIAFLILETGMIGTFVAVDLFLFYVMWEVMLIPMYFIIGVWGGDRRIYASIKFVLFTMVGSLLMLVAIFYLYVKHREAGGAYSFDLADLARLQLPAAAQVWCFAAFALAFAIKVPLFPLHTWLPDAHVEAPTSGSVILAGVLLKFGVYGFVRFAIPLFPQGVLTLGPVLFVLAAAGIIYGAVVAFAQEDWKKLVAYSSVSHLGFCVLGLFALNTQGIEGALYAGLSHGLTTSGLFLGIGVLYERRHTRKLADYGGVWARMPVFAGLYLVCTLGSAGLPGLSGFVGEFLSLLGGYDSGRSLVDHGVTYLAPPLAPLVTTLSTTGVIFGAVYLLYMFQKVFFGPLTNPKNQTLRDVNAREVAVFIPIVVGIFVMGFFPRPFLGAMERSVQKLRGDFATKLDDARTRPDELHLLGAPAAGAPVNGAPAPAPAPAAPPSPAPAPGNPVP